MLAKDLTDTEYFYGHKACPGCALGIVCRLALKVCGPRTMLVLPASCASSVTAVYPQMSVLTPQMTGSFPATGALLNGLAAGFQAIGEEGVTVLGIAGDGGTTDIGLQSLSGAIEQGRNFLYICYDNEAYMNTGIQRSSQTPIGATTTTTPAGSRSYGEKTRKKNLFEIMIAHRIPYAATASVSYVNDFVNKLKKAKETKGPAFIHVMAPCPTGWGFGEDKTMEIGRMAVENGLWSLMEYQDGKVTVNLTAGDPPKPVREYLTAQRRFRHLNEENIAEIEKVRDEELAIVRAWRNV